MDLLRSMTENLQPAAYRPSTAERVVLSTVIQSDTPAMAYSQVSQGVDNTTARDKLMRLGFITYNDGGLELTPSGEELATAQALYDNPEMADDPQGEAPAADGI